MECEAGSIEINTGFKKAKKLKLYFGVFIPPLSSLHWDKIDHMKSHLDFKDRSLGTLLGEGFYG